MRNGLDGEMKRRWESESLYISPDGCISRHWAIAMKLIVWATVAEGPLCVHHHLTHAQPVEELPVRDHVLMLIQSELESKTSATH